MPRTLLIGKEQRGGEGTAVSMRVDVRMVLTRVLNVFHISYVLLCNVAIHLGFLPVLPYMVYLQRLTMRLTLPLEFYVSYKEISGCF